MSKQSIMEKLNELYYIAQEREGFYAEYEKKMGKVNSKAESLNEVKVWQRLLAGAIFFVLFYLGGMVMNNFYVSDLSWDEQSLVAKIIGFAIIGIVLIGALVQWFMPNIIVRTGWYKKRMEKLEAEEQEIQDEYLPLMFGKVKEGMELFPELGQNYHTTGAISAMFQYLQSGRANTIKEMIDAYELDCHRNRVERNQDRLLYELAEQQDEINRLQSRLNYVTYYKQ